jgi:hypothetical protein
MRKHRRGLHAKCAWRSIYPRNLCLCSRTFQQGMREQEYLSVRQLAYFISKTAGRILIKPDMSMTFNFTNIQ